MAAMRPRLGVFLLLALSPVQAFGPADGTAPRPIVIDAGHGGEDLGAVVRGCREKDIALQVALRLRDRLQARGFSPVRLTRESDEFVPLDERVARVSAWDGGLFISLHANKVFWKKNRGITVYAYGRGRGRSDRRHRRHRRVPPLPPPPPEEARAGGELAARIAQGLRREGLDPGEPDRAEYYVLKNPRTPSVLVELGFLSNPNEARLLADPAYQERLAAGLAAGLGQGPQEALESRRTDLNQR
ncbi:MAG: N-acetylmuramoyl-L-alanine amidase [Elusimicrobia bacterium]|nr:N-acetylmuramoyl-L-alanine amidase [Elusimicrobiota bacterium]